MLRRVMICSLVVAVLLSLFLVPGCQQPPQDEAAAPPPVDQDPPEPPDEPAAPAEDAEKAAPDEFSWTETPSLDAIPEGTITGMINGEPFEAKTVRIQQLDDQVGAQLEISDQAVEEPTDIISEDTGVQLRFPIEEGTSGELVMSLDDDKDFDTTNAFYWYPQGDDKGPMSINADWGCALQIDDWTLEESEEYDDVVGTVTGKVAITFNDEKKSWVAGTFDCVYYEW
ncbi:MAG: hypothetical protein R6V19_02730 [Armatimonadota bacterium]